MKKYILISLFFHLGIFLIFKSNKNLGDEYFNKIVPITFVATKTSANPGAAIAVPKEPEKKEMIASKPKKKENQVEKKEIKSKIADKKEKKEEQKLVEKTSKNVIKEDGDKENTFDQEKNKNGNNEGDNNFFQGSNFIADGDGGYIALSSAGINYTILNEVEPDYPSQAEMIGYSKKVIVTVRFLVGLKGDVAKIEIKKSHAKLGFDDEVKKAIKKWKFKPIYHHGKNIQVYFEKDFIFNPI